MDGGKVHRDDITFATAVQSLLVSLGVGVVFHYRTATLPMVLPKRWVVERSLGCTIVLQIPLAYAA